MPSSSTEHHIVSLDIGSTSVRALIFDSGGRPLEGCTAQLPTQITQTPDGGAEVDPEHLADRVFDCLDEVHRHAELSQLPIAAVCGSAFWHGLMGLDADGRPTTPLLHLFDTRSTAYATRIPLNLAMRTGCPPHASYWPAKLLWLARTSPDAFAATKRWVSFSEYLFLRLFGTPRASLSMASASGLWNQYLGDWDPEMLRLIGVRREQLANPLEFDLLERELRPKTAQLWPAFKGASWLPLLGDGAANHIGSGCTHDRVFSLMVGTTGAMRLMLETPPQTIPAGLWSYRLDRKRVLIGGALSNGGEVLAWMKRTLALPRDIEARLDQAQPGTHGLKLLPFFAGERTPYWRGDLHAAITGLTFNTEPMDILRAGLEAVAVGFRQIDGLLRAHSPERQEIIASGGALLRSASWTQMMADALEHPITASTEPEASARGAAIWAMEQLGLIPDLTSVPASLGRVFAPRPEFAAAYAGMCDDRQTLYARLFPERKS